MQPRTSPEHPAIFAAARRSRRAVILLMVAIAAQAAIGHAQRPTFRSAREIVSIDVVVRDRQGNIVRGLTAADFEIREDGRPQEVLNFAFQEIADRPATASDPVPLLAGVGERPKEAAPPALPAGVAAGRRLIVLLFDLASMAPEDVQRAVDSARRYVKDQMSGADLVAVATVSSALDVLTDFTSSGGQVDDVLAGLAYTDGMASQAPAASTAQTDEEEAAAEEAPATEDAELDMFNNDVRLRALRILADALAPVEQKKAIIYFSSGMQRSGQDNMVELRAAVNAAVRGHVVIYPIDARGLQAVVPGGDARQASGRGQSLFSGRGVAQQFARLGGSQDTLVSLAAETGGRAFTDTNDFGEAFARVQRDMSGYYVLGYSSTNTVRDGRFRRVQVRVRRDGVRVEARPGYYAPRDFGHTSRGDREAQLEEQLFSPVSATDLPVLVTGGYFRLSTDAYYVPISVAVPGASVPVPPGKPQATLDVLGVVRDEQGRPLARIRQSLSVEGRGGATLAGRQVLYQTGVTLPPGRFAVKVVVRENTDGTVGSFEAPLVIPELKQTPLKLSSVVVSTQLQPAPVRARSQNPLARDGLQIIPNVTHVVGREQKLLFYFEVYDPAAGPDAPEVQASLAFYRGKLKVLETPPVTRTSIDAPDRRAVVFRLEVPGDAFKPGLYTCQVNVIDAAASRFAFPRLALYVR